MANYTDNYQFTKPTYAEIADVQTFNNNMTKIDEILHASQISLAPAYDPTKPYNAGDVVMYELLMYECQEDGVTGVWDPTKWARTTAGEHGGGSDVEPNPTGEPTATLNKLGIEGTIYGIEGSGGGNVYGAFIDTNRIIQAFTRIQDTQEHTYTATEDCAVVYVTANAASTDTFIKIDNVVVGGQYSTNISSGNDFVYLRKGQTFSFQQTFTQSTSTGFTVYGLTFGTNNIFTPQIYSLEERVVGVGENNKPLYQKTVRSGLLSPDTQETTPFLTDIDSYHVISLKTINGNNEYSPLYISMYNVAGNDTNYGMIAYNGTDKGLYFSNMSRVNSIYIEAVVQYTKTTDTAGSGSYNSLGVPMVHYSTDEQVIGTWTDGKTLYQKTFDLTALQLTDNNWNNNILGTTGIKIKHFEGLFSIGQTEPSIKYEYYRNSSQYFSALLTDDTSDINVRPNMNAGTLYAGTVTIQYTKTTD